MESLLSLALDPRFSDFVQSFMELRESSAPLWRDPAAALEAIGPALMTMLAAVREIVYEQHVLRDLVRQTVSPDRNDDNPLCPKAVEYLDSVSTMLAGGDYLDEALTVLQAVRRRLGPGALAGNPTAVLTRLDEALCLLGVREVCLRQLWEELGPAERPRLEAPLRTLLDTIEVHSVPFPGTEGASPAD